MMAGSTLNLDYVSADELAGCLDKLSGRILMLAGFGTGARDKALPQSSLWVDIPVLGEHDACYEVWSSSNPVTACNHAGVTGAADGAILFGGVQLEQPQGDSLETLANRAYTAIFSFVEHYGYPHLWRAWHYLPQINDPEQGLERYRRFNVGRHEAFVASGRGISEDSVPAASALGSSSGPLVIYFMAGKQPGIPIENPRQVSAYHYPSKYGPRSPTFARAMVITLGEQQCFIISGTASVVGHETLHVGDVQAQTQETLRNIRVLQQQAKVTDTGKMLLKIYLRYAEDMLRVREQIKAEFGECEMVFLQSNICRSDLLVEIEGICFN
jgi:chorismate lyase / 3-hydroxybenzoate synthase